MGHLNQVKEKKAIKALVKEYKRDIDMERDFLDNIDCTLLSIENVLEEYNLKPSELRNHQKNGLVSYTENGETMFVLLELMAYFDALKKLAG